MAADPFDRYDLVPESRQNRRRVPVRCIYNLLRLDSSPLLGQQGVIPRGIGPFRHTRHRRMSLQVHARIDRLLQQGADEFVRPDMARGVTHIPLCALDLEQLLRFRPVMVRDIIHDAGACPSQQVEAGLHALVDGVCHERVDCTRENEVAVDILVFDDLIERVEVGGLEGGAFCGYFNAVGHCQGGRAVVWIGLEVAAYIYRQVFWFRELLYKQS